MTTRKRIGCQDNSQELADLRSSRRPALARIPLRTAIQFVTSLYRGKSRRLHKFPRVVQRSSLNLSVELLASSLVLFYEYYRYFIPFLIVGVVLGHVITFSCRYESALRKSGQKKFLFAL